jgi:hypothetical protein
MKKIITILAALIVLSALVVPVSAVNAQPVLPLTPPAHHGWWWWGIPTFSIQSVVTDTSVTIVTNNFPAGYTFTVLMGAYGTLGIGGIPVATVNSGNGGSFTATYAIPAALKGAYQIAIRLEEPSGVYYAYNWFYNNTTAVVPPPCPPGYYGIPTFYIQSVAKDSSVTIVTNNFPVGYTFNVYMGYYGTLGIGGIPVTSFTTSSSSFTATYSVPPALDGLNRIAIRLQATSGVFYAYNWFWNFNAP